MKQLNKLKVAITIGIALLIIIAIVAVVLKFNNNTYISKETSANTIATNYEHNNNGEKSNIENNSEKRDYCNR